MGNNASPAQERRTKQRFSIALPLTYRVVGGKGESGSGTTVNISSTGLRFMAEARLAPGVRVELTLTWPALLNGIVPMKLIIHGTVVREGATDAAARIGRYEFLNAG